MKTKLLTLLLLLFSIGLFSQNYEKEGDDLFAQAQYEQAEKKYKAAIAINGETPSVKQKQEKCAKCKFLLTKAQTAEKESRYSDATKYYLDLYAIHSLTNYQNKANAMKQRARKAEQEMLAKQEADRRAEQERLAKLEQERIAEKERREKLQAEREGRYARGKLGSNISWEYYNGVLSISGIGNIESSTDLNDIPWYGIKDKITSIQISNKVTSIGDAAFIGCSNLVSITIPNSIIKIGSAVFSGCRNLAFINIPNSVNKIGYTAFSRCYALSITLPERFKGKVNLSDCKSVTYYEDKSHVEQDNLAKLEEEQRAERERQEQQARKNHADFLNYPLDTVNGEIVYEYKVEKSIGLYRICENFNVQQKDIIRLNPQLQVRGIRYGEIILVPTGKKCCDK